VPATGLAVRAPAEEEEEEYILLFGKKRNVQFITSLLEQAVTNPLGT
jgi:hypothetical protein